MRNRCIYFGRVKWHTACPSQVALRLYPPFKCPEKSGFTTIFDIILWLEKSFARSTGKSVNIDGSILRFWSQDEFEVLGDISLHSSSRVCASHGLPKSVFVEFKWCSGILDISVGCVWSSGWVERSWYTWRNKFVWSFRIGDGQYLIGKTSNC